MMREQAPKWIPISERLPEEDGNYLVTYNILLNNLRITRIASYAKDLNEVDEYDFYNKRGVSGWYDYDSEFRFFEVDGVIAWMPLPEPYKAESEVNG